MGDDSRAYDAASVCEWIETDDPEECKLTTTTTPPAPTYGEGCCTGYSMRTLSFCQDFENGDDCERAGVCSWIPGGDDDDMVASLMLRFCVVFFVLWLAGPRGHHVGHAYRRGMVH